MVGMARSSTIQSLFIDVWCTCMRVTVVCVSVSLDLSVRIYWLFQNSIEHSSWNCGCTPKVFNLRICLGAVQEFSVLKSI